MLCLRCECIELCRALMEKIGVENFRCPRGDKNKQRGVPKTMPEDHSERVREGMRKAKAKGVHIGRPRAEAKHEARRPEDQTGDLKKDTVKKDKRFYSYEDRMLLVPEGTFTRQSLEKVPPHNWNWWLKQAVGKAHVVRLGKKSWHTKHALSEAGVRLKRQLEGKVSTKRGYHSYKEHLDEVPYRWVTQQWLQEHSKVRTGWPGFLKKAVAKGDIEMNKRPGKQPNSYRRPPPKDPEGPSYDVEKARRMEEARKAGLLGRQR